MKAHQVKTFSAMQHALKRLMDEFVPEEIEKASTLSRGVFGRGPNKTACWDTFATRWKATTHGQEDGMLNTFMQYFAEYYDRDGNKV